MNIVKFDYSRTSKLISFSKGLGIILIFSHHFSRTIWISQGLHEPLLQQWQFHSVENKYSLLMDSLLNGELIKAFMLFFAYFGYIGVHLFIVASGIGLALGYRKNEAWRHFMIRRLSKIVPPFWFALIAYSVFWWVVGDGYSMGVIVRKMFLISTFYESEFLAIDSPLWFVGLIFQLYLIFPFLYHMANRYGIKAVPLLIVMSYIARYYFTLPELASWHIYFAHANFINWLPVSYMAIMLGQQLSKNQQLEFKSTNLFLIAFTSILLSILSLKAQVVYPITDSALAMLIVIVSFYLFQVSEKLNKSIILVGNVSFCIYLYHRPVVDKLLIYLYKKNMNDDVILFFVYIALFLFMVLLFNTVSSYKNPITKIIFPRG